MIALIYVVSFGVAYAAIALLILGGMLWVAELLCRVGRR